MDVCTLLLKGRAQVYWVAWPAHQLALGGFLCLPSGTYICTFTSTVLEICKTKAKPGFRLRMLDPLLVGWFGVGDETQGLGSAKQGSATGPHLQPLAHLFVPPINSVPLNSSTSWFPFWQLRDYLVMPSSKKGETHHEVVMDLSKEATLPSQHSLGCTDFERPLA